MIPPAETQQTILDSLLDWRDEDDLKRLAGAEEEDYRAQDLSYGPSNGLMNSVSELARVNGLTSAEYEALQSSMTVYSGQSRIDITSAPRRVLASLPAMDSSMTDSIINERATGNKHIDLTQISAETRKYIGAGQNEFIRISSFAEVNSSVSGIIAVIKLEATERLPVTVMSWRQHVDTVFMEKNLN